MGNTAVDARKIITVIHWSNAFHVTAAEKVPRSPPVTRTRACAAVGRESAARDAIAVPGVTAGSSLPVRGVTSALITGTAPSLPSPKRCKG